MDKPDGAMRQLCELLAKLFAQAASELLNDVSALQGEADRLRAML